MKLTFDKELIARLLENSKNATERNKTLLGEDGPGLWLVGDHGVYLMSNAACDQNIQQKDGNGMLVAYADQINPNTLPFEEWYDNKVAAFGGDDGCDFIAADMIEVMLEVSDESKVGIKLTLSDIRVVNMKTGKLVQIDPVAT